MLYIVDFAFDLACLIWNFAVWEKLASTKTQVVPPSFPESNRGNRLFSGGECR